MVLVDRDQLPSGPRFPGFSPSRFVFQERPAPQIFQAYLVSRLSHSATCLSHIHAILEKLEQLQIFNADDGGYWSSVLRDKDAFSCYTNCIDDLGKILTSRGSANLGSFKFSFHFFSLYTSLRCLTRTILTVTVSLSML